MKTYFLRNGLQHLRKRISLVAFDKKYNKEKQASKYRSYHPLVITSRYNLPFFWKNVHFSTLETHMDNSSVLKASYLLYFLSKATNEILFRRCWSPLRRKYVFIRFHVGLCMVVLYSMITTSAGKYFMKLLSMSYNMYNGSLKMTMGNVLLILFFFIIH
jgi:hypothetical protein